MSTFPPFLALFLVFLITTTCDARPVKGESNSDDLSTSYWRIATNIWPAPEVLQALFPTPLDKTHNLHHFSQDLELKKDPNAFYLNDYFPAEQKEYDADIKLSGNDHITQMVRPRNPNAFYLNGYFGAADHKKDGGSNDVDVEDSRNDHTTKLLERDQYGVYFGYFPTVKHEKLR